MTTITEKVAHIYRVDKNTKSVLYSWVLGKLLNESGYIEIVTPFVGGPYFFRKSDATFWELYEIKQSLDDSKASKRKDIKTTTLCFKKISSTTTCEIMQNSYNASLGSFNSTNNGYGYGYGYGGADTWTPASSNDPRRIRFNDKAQTKAPFTMAIALKPEIMDGCLDKHNKINKNTKSSVRKYRVKKAAKIVEMLNLKALDNLPIELARYSMKRKRRYYISTNGGGGPNGNKAFIWCINHVEPNYSGVVQVIKLSSYEELMDVCKVNNIKVPSRHTFKAQPNMLYID